MFLSSRYRFIFFRFPRTGSRAVRALIWRLCDVMEPGVHKDQPPDNPFVKHMAPAQARPILARLGFGWEDFLKFTVVRNPFDRLVSCYHHWQAENPGQGLPFDRFLQLKCRPERPIWGSIERYIKDEEGEVIVDRILRFERLAEELAALFRELQVPVDMERFQPVGASRRRAMASYYDEATIAFVREAYRYEFETFGYPDRPGEG